MSEQYYNEVLKEMKIESLVKDKKKKNGMQTQCRSDEVGKKRK